MFKLRVENLAPIIALLLLLPSASSAQSAMLRQCEQIAESFFGNYEARAEMQYNGQRTDGTHAVNGRIYLETRAEDFACSFAADQQRMVQFFAQGRVQNDAISGGSGGGTEFLTVGGLSAGDTLNLRSGPSTRYQVIGALGNGDRVRNLGCRSEGNSRWCRVGLMDDMGGEGWVNARYLKENAAVQLPASPPQAPVAGGTTTETVKFPPGATGAELRGTLAPGATKRYVLNARNGQNLYVRVAGNGLDYQIFNPNQTMLLDMIPASREYRGQLWQTGDHVVEVINRGNASQSYNVIFGIE